ncbi:sensor histidine kinase [Cohnella algarum]|uniref:sensor histidine kinase n=1 Tax=Cohnella algarum TaxID=2044859 RepID=UPI001F07F888|nr:HAMP domain-containing sensor histidine kinase [Cohnella algarum]
MSSNWKKDPYFVTKASIISNEKTIGSVLMFSPTSPTRSAAETLQNMFIVVVFIVLIMGAVIIFLVSSRIVGPLLRIINITRHISEGKYDWELDTSGSDEIAQLSQAIHRMSRNIQFYEQQRKQFLADISHELRTPITYMKGYSEALLKGFESSEEKRTKYINLLFQQSSQLQRLIEDLFDLAKLEEGTFKINFERTSLDKLMQNVLGLLADPIQQTGITLSYTPSPTPLYLAGDERRLQQVVVNLLENAKKYTPADGSITITTYEEDNFGVIEIADTGVGIPANDLPYIWERLYRVDRSRSRATGGTGLGLAICKEIVELHHGNIQVESTEGQGTVFCVRIPLFHETTGSVKR